MPDFAANLSFTFDRFPFVLRFEAAARAGFGAIEVSSPYAVPQDELRRLLRECRLRLIGFGLPGESDSSGAPGIADPERVAQFREGTRLAIDYATATGCRFLVSPDLTQPGDYAGEARRTLIENVRFAARCAMPKGIWILLEAANMQASRDVSSTIGLMDAVAARNVALLFRVRAIGERGQEVDQISRNLARIGHIQICGATADALRTNYWEAIFDYIDRIGHHGWIGCETAEVVEAGLSWMVSHGTQRLQSRWGIPVGAFHRTGAMHASLHQDQN